MSRKIILIKQELLLLVYELNRSGLLAENEKIRPILAQLEKLLLCVDECSRLLEASTMKSRRGFAIQRLMNAMRQAHADGWFIVFDTLTLADDRLEAFYDNPNA